MHIKSTIQCRSVLAREATLVFWAVAHWKPCHVKWLVVVLRLGDEGSWYSLLWQKQQHTTWRAIVGREIWAEIGWGGDWHKQASIIKYHLGQSKWKSLPRALFRSPAELQPWKCKNFRLGTLLQSWSAVVEIAPGCRVNYILHQITVHSQRWTHLFCCFFHDSYIYRFECVKGVEYLYVVLRCEAVNISERRTVSETCFEVTRT